MKFKSIISGLALIATLSACGAQNRGLESINQPVVEQTDYIFDLNSDGMGHLAYGESDKLDSWLKTINLRYADIIYIGGDPMSNKQNSRESVSEVIERHGMLLNEGVPAMQNEVPEGKVRIIVRRVDSSVPGCPNWEKAISSDFTGTTTPNYGCATNGALAAMIANSEDLIQGKADTKSTDNDTAVKAIEGFRAAPTQSGQPIQSESIGPGGGQ